MKIFTRGIQKGCMFLCSVCTIGYHTSTQKIQGKENEWRIKQDGFISVLALLMIILSLVTFLSVGQYLNGHNEFQIRQGFVSFVHILLMLSTIGFMICICIKRDKHIVTPSSETKKLDKRQLSQGQETNVQTRQQTSKPTPDKGTLKKDILPLFGMLMFLIGVFVNDIMVMIAYIDCMDNFWHNTYKRSLYLMGAATEIIYHIINILFTVAVTILCACFVIKNLHFYQSKTARLSCGLLLINVIWLWFQTQLKDAKHAGLITEALVSGDCNDCIEVNNSMKHKANHNYTFDIRCQCLCKQTPQFEQYNSSSVYFYTFVVEYCMLVIESLIQIMVTMVRKTQVPKEQIVISEIDLPTLQESIEESVEGSTEELSTTNQPNSSVTANEPDQIEQIEQEPDQFDDQPLLNNEAEPVAENMNRNNCKICSGHFFGLLVVISGLILQMTLFIMAAIHDNSLHSRRFTQTFYALQFLTYFYLTVLIYGAFRIAHHLRSNHTGYTGYEILITLSSAGIYLFLMLVIWANIATLIESHNRPDSKPSLYTLDVGSVSLIINIFTSAISMFQVYVQTVFMLHLSKLTIPRAISPEKLLLLQYILMTLAIANLTIWARGSFLELPHICELYPLHANYYGGHEWKAMSHLLYPIMMFYRFNSAIYFLSLFFASFHFKIICGSRVYVYESLQEEEEENAGNINFSCLEETQDYDNNL